MKKENKSRVRIITDKFEFTPLIDPINYYTAWDITRLWLLPWLSKSVSVKDYLYKLMLYKVDWLLYPYEETTATKIKTVNSSKIWVKSARWKVKWAELIKFLEYNNILQK